MRTRVDVRRLLLLWAICFLVMGGTALASLRLAAAALASADAVAFSVLLERTGDLPFLGGVMLLVVSGMLAWAMEAAWFAPVRRLAAAVRLLGEGGHFDAADHDDTRELRELAAGIGRLAERQAAAAGEEEARIAEVRSQLDGERNRFAALVSELPQSVLVCNGQRRILLYNEHARRLFAPEDASSARPAAFVGLGRSLDTLLDADQVEHALALIADRLARGEPEPTAAFTTVLASGRLVRVRLAPVGGAGAEFLSAGVVLLLEDVGADSAAADRRERLLDDLMRAVEPAAEKLLHALRDGATAEAEAEAQAIVRAHALARRDRAHARARHWTPERVAAGDLARAVARRLAEGEQAPAQVPPEADQTPVDADSYLLVLSLVRLAERLGPACGGAPPRVAAGAEAGSAWIDLVCAGGHAAGWDLADALAQTVVLGGQPSLLSVGEIVERHGAAASIEHAGDAVRLRLRMPSAPPPRARAAFPAARPEFYDFDLFHQPGQRGELDDRRLAELAYTVFDTETTGLDPSAGDEIISIGAVRVVNSRVLASEVYDQLVDPARPLDPASVRVHGIRPEMLVGQPLIAAVLPAFHRFCADTVLVAHNAAFDMRFLQIKERVAGVRFGQPVLDTLLLSAALHPDLEMHTLDAIARRLGIEVVGRHSAVGDALVTARILVRMIPLLAARGIVTLGEARAASERTYYARIRY